MSASAPRQVVIIGSGVIGMTCAYELCRKYPNKDVAVTIIARDMPRDGMDSTGWASPWAGANWFSFGEHNPENKWEQKTFETFTTEVPKEFIMDIPIKYYSTDPDDVQNLWYKDWMREFEILKEPFPTPIGNNTTVKSACSFLSISICVPSYLAWLEAQCEERGVTFVKGWVRSLADIRYVPGSGGKLRSDVIVNASGIGAKSIVGIADNSVYPIRGQTVLVKAPQVKWSLMGEAFYKNDETQEMIYFIPRSNGEVIVGGTFQEDRWDTSPDATTARGILERAVMYCPELCSTQHSETTIAGVEILRHNVGLRPARRDGPRVEKEVIDLSSDVGKDWARMQPALSSKFQERGIKSEDQVYKVVHAYGLSKAGYQQSWGVAADVVELVAECL